MFFDYYFWCYGGIGLLGGINCDGWGCDVLVFLAVDWEEIWAFWVIYDTNPPSRNKPSKRRKRCSGR